MATTARNTIKNWFKTGLKPTQSQFWSWLDSFWHKDDVGIPIASIENLQNELNGKVNKKDIATPEVWDGGAGYVYDADAQQYVSYINEASENPQFKVEGFYRLLADTSAGQSPETNPEKWAYQGQVLGEVSIDDVVGLTERLNNIEAELGGNSGSGTAYQLQLSANPTYNADGTVKIMPYTYVSDAAKVYEERFAYTNGVVSKIEIKDEMAAKWIQKTVLYNASNQLIKPTIADITAWTIV